MPLYRDEAVVLRVHKLGEADRFVTARFAYSLPVSCALASAVFALLLAAWLRVPSQPAAVQVAAGL